MAAAKQSKGEQKVTKQFIVEHLDEKEIDLSMCELSQVPVKELVSEFNQEYVLEKSVDRRNAAQTK